jgi:Fe-S cluster assembly iron-binding protein IscA
LVVYNSPPTLFFINCNVFNQSKIHLMKQASINFMNTFTKGRFKIKNGETSLVRGCSYSLIM